MAEPNGRGASIDHGHILGAIIGAAIIAQTMNMSVREHLSEFALLRAMGSSSSYVQTIVLVQVVAIAEAGS
jgi:putative ABC transport system permease protein